MWDFVRETAFSSLNTKHVALKRHACLVSKDICCHSVIVRQKHLAPQTQRKLASRLLNRLQVVPIRYIRLSRNKHLFAYSISFTPCTLEAFPVQVALLEIKEKIPVVTYPEYRHSSQLCTELCWRRDIFFSFPTLRTLPRQ